MPKVLIVGCGDLGGAVANLLAQLGIKTVGVKRSSAKLKGVTIIQADVVNLASLNSLNKIQPEILIYCVAANGQTDAQYQANYVEGLRNVLSTQIENPTLKHVFFVSSTRVYGQKTNEWIDESITAIPSDFGGERLLEAESLLKKLHCNSTVLRLSGLYGLGRLRMIHLAASLKNSSKNWPTQNGWTNRIHRDDAAAFIVYLIQQVLADNPVNLCYIVTDSKPIKQYEVLRWIAGQLNIHVMENVNPSIEGGKRLSNKAMLATGFKLKYPDYQAGYQALLVNFKHLS